MGKLLAALFRMVRVAIAVKAGTTVAATTGEPQALWLAPLLAGIMKALRMAFPPTTKFGKFLYWFPL